jgi:hypothetical protein
MIHQNIFASWLPSKMAASFRALEQDHSLDEIKTFKLKDKK